MVTGNMSIDSLLALTCYDQLPKARRKGTHFVANYARLISPDDHIQTLNDYFHIAFYFRKFHI